MFKGHPHASIMYQDSGQNSLPYEVNIMHGCVSFVSILDLYGPTTVTTSLIQFPDKSSNFGLLYYGCVYGPLSQVLECSLRDAETFSVVGD